MRFTIDHSLTDTEDVDLIAAPGVPLFEALQGHTAKRAWCGPTLLDPSQEVGSYPLLEGARLRDRPGPHTCEFPGFWFAAIAGPDAGVVIDLDDAVEVGSAPGRHRLRDDAVDPVHLSVAPVPGHGVACTDAGSTNGTGWWRQDGDRWHWSGRRPRFTARPGDVITVGATALQLRGGRWETAPSHRHRLGLSVARILSSLPRAPTPPWSGLPDPTAPSGWAGEVHITGPHARAAARAVVLARGRRPPAPAPFDEEWLRWLPDALPSDGVIRYGTRPPIAAGAVIDAHAHHTRLRVDADERPFLPVAVSQETADCLARRAASTITTPIPTALRWADVEQVSPSAGSGDLCVAVGVTCSGHRAPWTVGLNADSRHLLVAGARGAGNSTLLATLVGGLASRYRSTQLSVVLIGCGTDGPLAPCAGLPQVTEATERAGGESALRVLRGAVEEMRRRRELLAMCGFPDWRTWEASQRAPVRCVVVIDDFDATVAASREAAAAIEALATSREFVGMHLVVATHRPAGAVTPGLRASCGHVFALRATSEADSLGVIGVPDAAALEAFPGRAMASVGGSRATVQLALPLADPSPRVRRADADAEPGRHLAEAIMAVAGQNPRVGPASTPSSP